MQRNYVEETAVITEELIAEYKSYLLLSGKLNDVPSGGLFRADLGSLQIG